MIEALCGERFAVSKKIESPVNLNRDAMNGISGQASRGHQPICIFLQRWAPIPLRLIVGYGFWAHGFAKVARGPENFIGTLHALGVPAPTILGWTTIAVELGGGLAVLVGAFVVWVSMPMAGIMLVAIATVHLPFGFSSIKLQTVTAAGPQFGPPGYETPLLYLACLAALVIGGAGPFAVDGFLAGRRSEAITASTPNRSRP